MSNIQIPSQWLSKLSKDEQINELNNEVRATIRPSPVHGIGVFALRNIQKGARCYITPTIKPRFYNISFVQLNQLFPEIKELILWRWASVVNNSSFQSPNDDAHLLMFVNHAYYPDCNYDVVSDTALRDIKKGEELLEDYCAMSNATKVYPWLICKTSNEKSPNSLTLGEKVKNLFKGSL